MTYPYHPLIDPKRDGATTEQNLHWMENLREIQQQILALELEFSEIDLEEEPVCSRYKSLFDKHLECANTMIEANIPLVSVKLKTFILLYPSFIYLWDDMFSEGVLALTEGVHRLAKMPTPLPGDADENNPNGYLGLMIVRRTGRMLRSLTRKLPEQCFSPLNVVVDPRDIVETRDLLEVACETTVDRVIMQLHELGHTQKEIADRLDLAQPAVCVYLHEIRTRYDQLLAEALE